MFKRRISTQFSALFVAILLGTLGLLWTSAETSRRVEQRMQEITDQTLIVTKQLHEIRHLGSAISSAVNETVLLVLLADPAQSWTSASITLPSSVQFDDQLAQLHDQLSQYSSYVDAYFPEETDARDKILMISSALTRATSKFLNRMQEKGALNGPQSATEMQKYLRNLKAIEDDFLSQIDNALEYEHDELRERIERLDETMTKAQHTVWMVFAVLFSLVLFTGLMIVRRIINRIHALNKAANDISTFDLSSRVIESGADELGDLARVFNIMAQRLQDMIKSRDQAQEKLKGFNEQLQTLVEAQTEELRAAMVHAEAASNAKTRFLSAMSHELRTPLNAIFGYAQIMELKLPNTSGDDQRKQVAAIRKSSEVLLALIDEILILSSMKSDALSIHLRETNLEQVLTDSMKSIMPLSKNNSITIVNEVPPLSLPRILANSDHLQKVFFNLLSNAVKYNHHGGRVIVQSTIIEDFGKVRVTVKDTGQGFKEEHPGQALEAFERLDFENSSIDGAGVGLTIVKGFLMNMDGELGYTSTLGKGSEFWVDLPIAR